MLFRAKVLNLRIIVSTEKIYESELMPHFWNSFQLQKVFDPNEQQIKIHYAFVEWIKFAWQPQINIYLHKYLHWIHMLFVTICRAKAFEIHTSLLMSTQYWYFYSKYWQFIYPVIAHLIKEGYYIKICFCGGFLNPHLWIFFHWFFRETKRDREILMWGKHINARA